MKTASEWQFSAPLAEIDLPRVMREAESVSTARGVVVVTLPKGVIVLVDNEIRKTKFDLQRPSAYLTHATKVKSPYGGIVDFASASSYAPPGAVAVYQFPNRQDADVFIGKALDRTEVKVEVY